MRDTQRERQKEAETQAEGEAGSTQGAQHGTQSRVSRIMSQGRAVLNHWATRAALALNNFRRNNFNLPISPCFQSENINKGLYFIYKCNYQHQL